MSNSDYSSEETPMLGVFRKSLSLREKLMEKTYAYHKPGEEGLSKIKTLREAFSSLHNLIKEIAPESREKSVAFTQLETTAMWAIKAVVCNDPESVIEQ